MLNETDFKNLGIFLSRVSLTGQEAPTFTELVQKINLMEAQLKKPVTKEKDGKDTGTKN